MKTIICNNCVGAEIYRMLGCQFDNPFMWNLIEFDSYAKLIEEFDTLDLSDISTRVVKDDAYGKDRHSVVLTVAGHIEIPFIHHHWSETARTPMRSGRELYYSDIQALVKDNWNRRMQRMSDDILFIYINRERPEFNQRFAELKTAHRKLLVTKFRNISSNECGFPVMYGIGKGPIFLMAERILTEHKDLIV